MQKGVTAIVATILLVLITISLVGATSIFFNRTQSAAAQSGEEQLEQTLTQISTSFKIDYVDKNKVFIRNLGNRELANLDFFVNNVRMEVPPLTIDPKEVGEFVLDDAKLSMMTDPAELKVTSGRTEVKQIVSFYEHYTVGHWKLDEGAGSTAKDSSTKNNDGTITGAQWTDGKIRTALDFDGTDDFVNITNDLSIEPYSITVQAWVKFDGLAGRVTGGMPEGHEIIIFKRNSRTTQFEGYILSKNPENKIVFAVTNSTGYHFSVAGSTAVIGEWHHYAGTFDNATKNLSLYVDGTLVDSKTGSSSFTMDHSNQNLYFGRTGQPYDAFFNGTLDDVRILRIARSMEKIA